MSNALTEKETEQYALDLLLNVGWDYLSGDKIERSSFGEVVLTERLRSALAKLNPHIPAEAREKAMEQVIRLTGTDVTSANRLFHEWMTEKVGIPYQEGGDEKSHLITLIDFDNPERNDFLAVNQFTIIGDKKNERRPDIILFVNGLPLVVIELKNPSNENATLSGAFKQIETYLSQIGRLFFYNALCIVSDGLEAKTGTHTSDFNRFMKWKSSDGKNEASRKIPELETMIKGMLTPAVVLDLVRYFTVYEESGITDPKTGIVQTRTDKKIAAYHQYYAVNKALDSTLQASGVNGDRKGGVVWHTQGSGKSLSMVFFAGKLVTSPALKNPTVVVITDRNDLDEQLFGTFSKAQKLLRQKPVQAESRTHLKELLKTTGGGVVFTTIQKFIPEEGSTDYECLTERSNVIVIADEAHRTQYGFSAKIDQKKDGANISYGFAKNMRDALPNATYIGFTGTPIESKDINTPQVFGNYIDKYDISQAVADGATVKIYYESRLAKINLTEEGRKLIAEFDESIGEDEMEGNQKWKAQYSKLEAIVGTPERLKVLASDLVSHFESRIEALDGKGMIVCMNRRIAVDLYNQITKLKPEWHDEDLKKGVIKVVMTASASDGAEMAKHHTTKDQRHILGERLKNPSDALKLVIVVDMWLTGFDAPCLHTLYIDKPMKGHSLMQAIARVNRVFQDKTGGLVVDYLCIATELKNALAFYANSGGKGEPAESQEDALGIFLEKMESVRNLFVEKSYNDNEANVSFFSRFMEADFNSKLTVILECQDFILGIQDGKNSFIREVTVMNQAFALSVPHERALALRDEIAFYQAVKARLAKFNSADKPTGRTNYELESNLRQIMARAFYSDQVIDLFDAVGLDKPEISILSEEFLKEIEGMKTKNTAIELLKKLLKDEIKTYAKRNLVKSREMLEMLESVLNKYHNNMLTITQVIDQMIQLAKHMNAEIQRGKLLGLTDDELAFYDALETNDSAVKVLGDSQLKDIAKEIADTIRKNTKIDWSIRESARADLRRLVKRVLNQYGYPPDKQQKAVDTVLEQAKLSAINTLH